MNESPTPSRPTARDRLVGHDLVDVVARREDARTRRLPPERGGHILCEVADNRPVFLESELVGDRQEEGVGLREGAVLAQLLDERRGQCVRDQVQGCGLLGEIEGVS